jgi:RNA polymerase sigma-70 factor, ECF subfamily
MDSGLDQVLDRELVSAALWHLSPAHRTVVVETFYNGGSLAAVANELGIPNGTARSRLHYALQALNQAPIRIEGSISRTVFPAGLVAG